MRQPLLREEVADEVGTGVLKAREAAVAAVACREGAAGYEMFDIVLI